MKQHAQQLINHFPRRVQIMLYIDQNAASRGLGVGTISWLHVCEVVLEFILTFISI